MRLLHARIVGWAFSRALWLVLGCVASLSTSFGHAAEDRVKEPLFAPADSARASADAVQAAVLSPRAYGAALEKYTAASERFDEGGNLDRIADDVAEAARLFTAAAASAPATNRALSRAVIARTDAESARAASYIPEAWEDAEADFRKVAARAESGNAEAAMRDAPELETLYRVVELNAIKAAHLNGARTLLVKAKEAKAEKLAPVTYTKAQGLLARAEKLLDGNRYDTDPPRQTAELAEHEAQHAIYIANEARRTGADNLESTLIAWEKPLLELAALLDVPIHFGDGPESARVALVAELNTRLDEMTQLGAELDAYKEQVQNLEQEVARVNTEVGGQLAQRTRELERQTRLRERLAQVERTFELSEAQVVLRGNQIILRLTGLSFAPGSTTIRPDHYPLLRKVQQAISLFPVSHFSVEGHTDTRGSSEQNLDLSKRRADAVMAWILANMPLSPANIQALGYGETRPVASNDSEQGRAQNRRIDIVIEGID